MCRDPTFVGGFVVTALVLSFVPRAAAQQEPEYRTISRDADAGESSGGTSEVEAPLENDLSESELESRARERELEGRDYPWHDRDREVGGDYQCPDVETVEYSGRTLSYNRPIEVNPRFEKRLARFEKLVAAVSRKVYGRAPDEIVQWSGHNCRTVGRKGEKLSEHAFGHAIDVGGFNYDAFDGDQDQLKHRKAAGAFEVRVADHWHATEGFGALHRRFLRRLANTLEQRGPFSTLLGPAYPGHDRVFHFDFGPEFFFRID